MLSGSTLHFVATQELLVLLLSRLSILSGPGKFTFLSTAVEKNSRIKRQFTLEHFKLQSYKTACSHFTAPQRAATKTNPAETHPECILEYRGTSLIHLTFEHRDNPRPHGHMG